MYLTRSGKPCLVVSVMNVEKFPFIVSSHPWEARNVLSCCLVITCHTVSCLVELNVKALPCARQRLFVEDYPDCINNILCRCSVTVSIQHCFCICHLTSHPPAPQATSPERLVLSSVSTIFDKSTLVKCVSISSNLSLEISSNGA